MSTSATNEMFHGGFLESDRGEILFSRQTDRYHNNLHYRERAVDGLMWAIQHFTE